MLLLFILVIVDRVVIVNFMGWENEFWFFREGWGFVVEGMEVGIVM